MLTSKPSIIASAVLLSLGLTACGGSSKTDTTPVVVNVAPTAVALDKSTLVENDIAAIVGTLTTTDADVKDTFTYAVDDARFEIVNNELKLVADTAINFEQEYQVALKVTVTDSAKNTFTQDLSVTITDSHGVDSVLADVKALVPTTYAFTSKLGTDDSSVSYGGQIARQVLIIQLTNYIGSGLQADFDAGMFTNKADVLTKLMSMYAGTSDEWETKADAALNFSGAFATKQTSLGDISSSHKNLQGKIAGQDAKGQHKDWATEFEGWDAKGDFTPDSLVQHFFGLLADNVQTELNGSTRVDILGETITKFYLQDNGMDLKQLTQKFLLGAVNFSQGTDDYLDNATDSHGLNGDNLIGAKSGSKVYTSLEHTFDEGFGYFGAARNNNDYTDLEIRAKSGRDGWKGGYNDIDADGKIDLVSEYNFGNSTNAAKRDVGSVKLADGTANPAATDLTTDAFNAFLTARTIINSNVGAEFSPEQKATLLEQRDEAVFAWEKAISATMVHYINEVIKDDLATIGTAEFNYANLAKHWSELKGFSLGLQFNPNSPVTDAQYTEIQSLIGMKPALVEADVAAYKANLLAARDILQAAYNFDAATVTNW